jgi:hypothetical protein
VSIRPGQTYQCTQRAVCEVLETGETFALEEGDKLEVLRVATEAERTALSRPHTVEWVCRCLKTNRIFPAATLYLTRKNNVVPTGDDWKAYVEKLG